MRKLYAHEKIVGETNKNGVECWIVRADMQDAPVSIDTIIPKNEIIIEEEIKTNISSKNNDLEK